MTLSYIKNESEESETSEESEEEKTSSGKQPPKWSIEKDRNKLSEFRFRLLSASDDQATQLRCDIKFFRPVVVDGDAKQPQAEDQPAIIFYELVRASWLTPNTHTISTPASRHVFDKAMDYIFDEINGDGSEAFTTAGYVQDEAAEYKLKRDFGEVVEDAVKELPGDVALSRRFNGPIQWSTFLVFFMLMIHAIARLVVYTGIEAVVLQSTATRKNVRSSKSTSSSKSKKTGSSTQSDPASVASAESADVSPDEDWNLLIREYFVAEEAVQVRKEKAKRIASVVSKMTSFGPWKSSCAFLDLYQTACAAFLVSGTCTSVPTFLDSEHARILEERLSRHALMKYLLWSIPTIGFVGTVVGIGDALLETMNVESINLIERAISKSTVSSSIGVAFDTTLVALLLSLVGMLVYNLIAQFEELAVTNASSIVSEQFMCSSKNNVSDEKLGFIMAKETQELIEQSEKLRHTINDIGDIKVFEGIAGNLSNVIERRGRSGTLLFTIIVILMIVILAILSLLVYTQWDQINLQGIFS